jgi:hemolysin III
METDPDRFIVEPWNAFSALLMLIPAMIWLIKVRGELSHYRFLLFAILMVILGGLGSALFHGFRASTLFLVMDVVPSALLTLSLSIYLWIKILKRWWYIFFILVPTFGVRLLFWNTIPDHMAINVSYFISGVVIALPLLIILFRDRFHKWLVITLGVTSFVIALFFRQLDATVITILPMGTHFLWHVFSAVGAWFILDYIHYLRDVRLIKQKA